MQAMNFIKRITSRPADGEPNLKQAHTGQKLEAHYDEKLKRWVFPGEDLSAVSQELAPPPMVPGPAAATSAPRRFTTSGRSLYTDPLAEMQGVTSPKKRMSASDLFPPALSIHSANLSTPFPVSDSMVEETTSQEAVISTPPPDQPGDEVVNSTCFKNDAEPTPIPNIHNASDIQSSQRENSNSLFPNFTPATDLRRLAVHGSAELSSIDPMEDTVSFGDYSTLNRGKDFAQPPPSVLLPRDTVERNEWFGEEPTRIQQELQDPEVWQEENAHSYSGHQEQHYPQREVYEQQAYTYEGEFIHQDDQQYLTEADQNTAGIEISILGHPLPEGPLTFPSHGRRVPVGTNFDHQINRIMKSSSREQIQEAITECAAVVRNDPVNRAIFCETIEAVSFAADGPIKESASDAVPVLVSCLEESLVAEDDEEVSYLNRSCVAAAIGALWNLHNVEVSTQNIISLAKQAMDTYPEDCQIQSNSAGLLVHLTADSLALSQGCLESLMAAVRNHPSNALLIEQVCQLFAMIAARKDLRHQLPSYYCQTLIDVAEREHAHDPAVTKWANWLISVYG